MSEVPWNALVLTCQNPNSAHAFQRELEIRQKKGLIHKDVLILTIEDPKFRVGSGGATINALLLVAEHLSAKSGFPIVNPNVFLDVKIVVMHMGRNFPYDACGRTFTTLPSMLPSELGHEGLKCNIDDLLEKLQTKITVKSPPGVWVCSTDMFLDIPEKPDISWSENYDVLSLSVPVPLELACQHGVYDINEQGYVERTIYKGDPEDLKAYARPDGLYNLVLGVVYFSPRIVEILLSFHAVPPLNGCTYYGLDSGAPPLQLSIFFDLLAPMYGSMKEEDFLSKAGMYLRSLTTGSHQQEVDKLTQTVMFNARSVLWNSLHRFNVKAVVLEGCTFTYMSLSANDYMNYILNKACEPGAQGDGHMSKMHSMIKGSVTVGPGSMVVNTILGSDSTVGRRCIISHCALPDRSRIGNECFVSGVRMIHADIAEKSTFGELDICDGIVVQGFNIFINSLRSASQHVYTLMGKDDNLQVPMSAESATFCNKPWQAFFERTGVVEEDLWGSSKAEEKTLLTAKLFPVLNPTSQVGLKDVLWLQSPKPGSSALQRWRYSWRLSIQEILLHSDLCEEFEQRRVLFFKIGAEQIKNTLLQKKGRGLMPLYRSAAVEGFSQQVLATLDEVIIKCSDPGIAARTLGNIADVLDCMSFGEGGLRSGPALNQDWEHAFNLLKKRDIHSGVEALTQSRNNWLSRPDHLIRAARHFEGAGQIFISQAVHTAKLFINPVQTSHTPKMDQWVVGEAPARIDIAGGWSDTPPMTYEHGGAVVNAAILVNGKRPIGAKARRIPDLKIVFVLASESTHDTVIEITELHQLEDYCCPQAPGALLKACMVASQMVNLESTKTLQEQLQSKFACGFEIHSWTKLPHGSGLGTSSILAGVVMAVLWKQCGMLYQEEDLLHAVLHVEQLLTTGGGWQDQVGGLTPAVKMGHSNAGLPLKVEVDHFTVSEEMIESFNSRIMLVYTGKTRLAKNLLQNAVRAWYGRDPIILDTMDNLVLCAEQCKKAFIQGNIEKVGEMFSKYWQLKKRMATGSEPHAVTKLIELIQPYILAACMAGAGGGGFLYLLLKEPSLKSKVLHIIDTEKEAEGMVLYDAAVDTEGLQITIEDDNNNM